MPPITSHPLSRGYAPVWASSWGQDEYGPWIAFRIGDVEQCLRWIPPGTFWMGSPNDDPERFEREKPQHQVRLSEGFWLFDTPCTQGLWEAVMGENPSRFQGVNRPVENVSWEDCQAFIIKVNEQIAGLHLRLPTEAQWEYACRAGTQEPRYDSDVDAIAWYAANSDGETHDVGQKHPNTWGLYDMLGNVDEWVQDWYGDYTAA
jgi:formylglycine-generating enzyme